MRYLHSLNRLFSPINGNCKKGSEDSNIVGRALLRFFFVFHCSKSPRLHNRKSDTDIYSTILIVTFQWLNGWIRSCRCHCDLSSFLFFCCWEIRSEYQMPSLMLEWIQKQVYYVQLVMYSAPIHTRSYTWKMLFDLIVYIYAYSFFDTNARQNFMMVVAFPTPS